MGKVVNITDKLSLAGNPKLQIKDIEIEVKSDAKTMLEIMEVFSKKSQTEAVLAAYEKIFGEKDREKLEAMELQFSDLQIVIEEAMKLAQGDDGGGEQ